MSLAVIKASHNIYEIFSSSELRRISNTTSPPSKYIFPVSEAVGPVLTTQNAYQYKELPVPFLRFCMSSQDDRAQPLSLLSPEQAMQHRLNEQKEVNQ